MVHDYVGKMPTSPIVALTREELDIEKFVDR